MRPEEYAKDPYRVLQVDPEAEPEVIEGAYKRLAAKYHPDVNKSADAGSRMRDINAAYGVLSDPERRRRYDRLRASRSSTEKPRAGKETGHEKAPSEDRSSPRKAKAATSRRTKASDHEPPEKAASRPGSAIPRELMWAIALVVIISCLVLYGALRDGTSTTPYLTRTPTPRPTVTRTPKPTSTLDPCLWWDEVNPGMEGATICVKGNVALTDFVYAGGDLKYGYRPQWRVFFSDRAHTFFLLDSHYNWPDVQKGDCVFARGPVELDAYKTPFIDLGGNLYTCG